MRGFGRLVILVPLALAAVAFAIGNRASVSLSFDPFSADAPAYTIEAPIFVVVFAALILGVLVGGLATWIGQRGNRRVARLHRREVARLRADLDRVQGAPASVPAARA